MIRMARALDSTILASLCLSISLSLTLPSQVSAIWGCTSRLECNYTGCNDTVSSFPSEDSFDCDGDKTCSLRCAESCFVKIPHRRGSLFYTCCRAFCPNPPDLCEAGTYSANGRSHPGSCLRCPPGSYSSYRGASSCTSCVPGTFSGGSGAWACTRCRTGTFSNGTPGASICSACSAGYSSAAGETACSACKPGSYSDVRGSCKLCSSGTYSSVTGASSSSTCLACAPGKFSRADGSTLCSSCRPGCFSNVSRATTCTLCSQGFYSRRTGASSASTCVACPKGSFSIMDGTSSCQACTHGRFSDEAGATACNACPPGTYAQNAGASTCSPCPSPSRVLCLYEGMSKPDYATATYLIALPILLLLLLVLSVICSKVYHLRAQRLEDNSGELRAKEMMVLHFDQPKRAMTRGGFLPPNLGPQVRNHCEDNDASRFGPKVSDGFVHETNTIGSNSQY